MDASGLHEASDIAAEGVKHTHRFETRLQLSGSRRDIQLS